MMKRLGSILFSLLFLFLIGCNPNREDTPVPSPEPVTLQFSTNHITIGQLIEARLVVRHPVGARVEAPEPSDSAEWVVRNRTVRTVPVDAETERTEFLYGLTSFQLGAHSLVPTGVVTVVDADGVSVTHPYPDNTLTVDSVLDGPDQAARPDKPLRSWPAPWPRWVPVLLGIALLAALAAFIAARVLRKPHTPPPPPPPVPAHERALTAMKNLLAQQYIERGEVEPFFVELSLIARRYIEDRFRLRAPNRTTEEFLRAAIRARSLSEPHQMLVRTFLEQCDLVKFARHRPGSEEMRSAYHAAERLVHETTPAEVAS